STCSTGASSTADILPGNEDWIADLVGSNRRRTLVARGRLWRTSIEARRAQGETPRLDDEHRIAIAVKPVLSLNRLFVRSANQRIAAEATHQHQQRAAW